MQQKLYGCYEHGSTGWNLVVYHGEKPGKPVGSQAPQRTEFFEVPSSMIDDVGEPILGLIQKKFPAPMVLYKDEPIRLEPKEESHE